MERPNIPRFVHHILPNEWVSFPRGYTTNLTDNSALRTKLVELRAAGLEKVYVHQALLNGKAMAIGGCSWSCFSSTTVTSFVEYLYQGDYTPPPVVTTSLSSSVFCSDDGTDEEICEEILHLR